MIAGKHRWLRVSRQNPCAVVGCGRPDWCTFTTTDDGRLLSCCMRIASDKPCKNGGFLHYSDTIPTKQSPRPIIPTPPKLNVTEIIRSNSEQTTPAMLSELAGRLNVSIESLIALRTTWSDLHNAWAFPMYDSYGSPIGIRLRANDGKKWSVKGSRSGIFLPDVTPQPMCFLPEGASDTLSILSIGLYAIGRPSCVGNGEDIVIALRRLKVRSAVIVADDDSPGINGAIALQNQMKIPSCIFVPPCKDIREYIALGATKDLILSSIQGVVWKQPI